MGSDLVGMLGDDYMDMDHAVFEGRCIWKNLVVRCFCVIVKD